MRGILFSENYRMAIDSIRGSKIRSFLTMIGVIIGVVSVVTTVSLGEGVKNQVAGQIGEIGADHITIQPGKLVQRDNAGEIVGVNLLSTLGRGTLPEADLDAVRSAKNIEEAVPFNLITGSPKVGDRSFGGSTVIAVTDNLPGMINHDLEFGSFFTSDEMDGNRTVVGRNIASNFFGENVPIGKSIEIRGKEFVVSGIFETFSTNPIDPTLDMNNAIFIPYDTGKEISDGSTHIFQIIARADDPANTQIAASSINQKLLNNHGGEDDFTVLEQEETLAVAQNVVRLVTGLVAGIAAVSLLIGGIGIMNIMLVSVSERTREIGIRKSIGATNRQIRQQFLIEAIVLSVWGAVIGLFISLLVNIGIRIFSDLQPIITWQVVAVSTGVAIVIGTVFGIAPAIKASLKDPIESLRSQ